MNCKNKKRIKKVGILTFVGSNNYGTLLQAYASVKLLQNALGDEFYVEIVNIRFYTSGVTVARKLLQKRKLKEYWFVLKRRWNHIGIKKFLRHNLPVSPEKTGMNYIDCIKYLKEQNYDVLVSGSDEIWANKPGVPIPNIFFIPQEVETLKISMASSANRGDYELLNDEQKVIISQALCDYAYISVRDDNTKRFIKNFTNESIHILSDPTLAYDFPEIVYKNTEINKARRQNKKVIGLMLKEYRIAQEIIRQYGDEYLIVSVFTLYEKTVCLLPNPLEFPVVFNQFDLAITDFFHGTVFCIKNNVPFIAIDSEDIYKKYESKIAYMLKYLSLDEHYLQIWENDKKGIESLHYKIHEMLRKSFDYSNNIKEIKSEYQKAIKEIIKIINEN